MFNKLKEDPDVLRHFNDKKNERKPNNSGDGEEEEAIVIYEDYGDLEEEDNKTNDNNETKNSEERGEMKKSPRRAEREKTPSSPGEERNPAQEVNVMQVDHQPSPNWDLRNHIEDRAARRAAEAEENGGHGEYAGAYHHDFRPNYMHNPANFFNPPAAGGHDFNGPAYPEPSDFKINQIRDYIHRKYQGYIEFQCDMRHEDLCTTYQCQEKFSNQDVVCGFYSEHHGCYFNYTHDDRKNEHRWIHICNNCWRATKTIAFHRAMCPTCPINRCIRILDQEAAYTNDRFYYWRKRKEERKYLNTA